MIEIVRVALTGLSANKLRSGLTILGLMIGVGSVIILVAVGTGSSARGAVPDRSRWAPTSCSSSPRRRWAGWAVAGASRWIH